MKIIALLLCSIIAFAEEIPSYMKDGTIIMTLKDGKKYTFSTNEYKVVRRGSNKKKQDAAPSKKEESPVAQNKNRVRVMGGFGPAKLETTKNSDSATVRLKNDKVGGIGYDRLITDRVSIGGQAQSNGTYLFNIGLDF